MLQGILSMKAKYAFLIMAFMCIATLTNAAPIDSVTAKIAATNFFKQQFNTQPTLSLAYSENLANGALGYYVYNVNSKNGFVIMAADDAAEPVLGYSDEGYFNATNISPEFAFWMQRYKTQIEYIQQHHIQATAAIQNKWNAYKNNLAYNSNQRVQGNINPLVQTTWAQAPYYNADCPGTGANQAVAGCVATAMGQIMKYWNYPPHGKGSFTYNDPPYGSLSANFDTTHYYWTSMPLNVSHSNPAVASFTYDCAVGVGMAFSPSASSSYLLTTDNAVSAESAFIQYFGYDPSGIQGVYRSGYTDANWTSLVLNELSHGRPLIYAGSGSQGGHAWVCDGYQASNGYFHMNWGWGGGYDGYFSLNNMVPDGIDLNANEEVLIGLHPAPAVVDFWANYLVIWAGDTVTFTDNSFGPSPVTSRQWSLPGAATDNSSLQNPQVVYPNAGTYNVSETVTTASGNATVTQNNYITVLENNTVNVFPSVNQGTFTIKLQSGSLTGSNIQFSLYDMLGQKVYATTLVQFTTQVTVNLQHGIYFFRAFNSAGKPVSTGKIAIQQ